MSKKIKNIKDLREDLLERYENAATKEDRENLAVHTQAASAIIRSVKVELDYNRVKNIPSEIEFLEVQKSKDEK